MINLDGGLIKTLNEDLTSTSDPFLQHKSTIISHTCTRSTLKGHKIRSEKGSFALVGIIGQLNLVEN